jgi:hypothetical protein
MSFTPPRLGGVVQGGRGGATAVGARRRGRRFGVIAILVTALLSAGAANAATSSSAAADQTYTSEVDQTVHITTRYGDKLTIELQLPAINGKQAPGKFPVIACLCYITNVNTTGLPTGGNISAAPGPSPFTHSGYVAATVRVAGSGTSEGGPWDLSSRKWQEENYDAIEWLGTQPWSTGKVGTIGESGNGMSQIFTSQLRPPHLTTMIAEAAGADSYDTLMPGGMLSLQIAAFACGIPGALTTLPNGVPIPVATASTRSPKPQPGSTISSRAKTTASRTRSSNRASATTSTVPSSGKLPRAGPFPAPSTRRST